MMWRFGVWGMLFSQGAVVMSGRPPELLTVVGFVVAAMIAFAGLCVETIPRQPETEQKD